jgi:hypothetical protein
MIAATDSAWYARIAVTGILAASRRPDVIGVSPDVVAAVGAFGVHGIVWVTGGFGVAGLMGSLLA